MTRIERNAAIVKAARCGASYRGLARKHGISWQAVSMICRKAGMKTSQVRERLIESGAANRAIAEERRAEAAIERRTREEQREREMEAVRHLVEDEGLSALAAVKRLGLTRTKLDYWHALGFRLKSLHGPGSLARRPKPAEAPESSKHSVRFNGNVKPAKRPDKPVKLRKSAKSSQIIQASIPQPAKPRAVIAVDFPTFSENERKRLAIQRMHTRKAGSRRKVSIKELQAAVQASDVPVQRLPPGAHAGWRPSWTPF